MRNRNIYLIGMMGTGKTTIGRLVSSRMQMDFIDSDHEIERKTGMKINEIFNNYGEKRFRELEEEFIRNGHPVENCLVSCGGGLCVIDGMIEKLKTKGLVICLFANPNLIFERVKSESHRPLLQVNDPVFEIKKIMETRKDTYFKADLVIKTDNLTPDEVTQKIIDAFSSTNISST